MTCCASWHWVRALLVVVVVVVVVVDDVVVVVGDVAPVLETMELCHCLM